MSTQKQSTAKIKQTQQKKKVHQAMVEKMTTLILAGFGLVAALAWNDAIKLLFETIFGKQQTLIAKFLYAVFVTGIIVIISIKLKNFMGKVIKKGSPES